MRIKYFYLTLALTLPIILGACNKAPDRSGSETRTTANDTASTAPATHTACQKLNRQIAEINHQSKIEALNQVNTSLKACIPKASNAQQLKWLQETTHMYQRFLNTSDVTEQQANAFVDYGFSILDQEQQQDAIEWHHPLKGDSTIFKKLSPRDQYLLNHQDQAYIELQYQGEGMFSYRRQPQYILDLFAAVLPKDQNIFVQRMAKDNQEIFFNDAAIAISWSEMVNRALFWENYLKQYPKAHFRSDAEKLFNEYQYFIFFGLDNTPVSDEYVKGQWIDENALKEIEKLAKRHDTSLNLAAKKFINFINTPVSERSKNITIPPIDDEGYEKTTAQIAHEQLKQILKLADPWQQEDYHDCHTDAVCIGYTTN